MTSPWTHRLARQLQVAVDLVVLSGAFWLSYLLRFDFVIPPEEAAHALIQLPLVVLIQQAMVMATGIQSFVWRYVGLSELQAFVRAAVYSALPILLLRFGLSGGFQAWRVPLSIILMDALLAFGGLLGIRVLRRIRHEMASRRNAQTEGPNGNERVLIVGAGHAGVTIAREIRTRSDTGLKLIGFLDDDASKLGLLIQGARVLGTPQQLQWAVQDHDIDQVVIATPPAEKAKLREIVEACDEISVHTRIIPGLHEILGRNMTISRLREVQIEDLLGRAQVDLDEEEVARFLTGRRVMITGAGGSIGSELTRQVARFHPGQLILVDRAEFALFEVDRELGRIESAVPRVALVADVGDEGRMRAVLSKHRPEVVFHAAAHKHVPLMETNCSEVIKNNLLATELLGRLSGEFDVQSFVFVSTDKAVRPTSLMGASKRVAELVLQDLDTQLATRFVVVRFGNVMGSAGSVIPIFRRQIARGGPLTVTHPDMTRYFMTITEASQLVLQAGAIGDGGEILILDMGEPVAILDLAKDMITLSGLRPHDDIEIEFTGPRPGEKLVEELELSGEGLRRTRHPKIFIGHMRTNTPDILTELRQLGELASLGLDAEIRETLSRLLPEADVREPRRQPPRSASLRSRATRLKPPV